jgi:hypothetical protein
VGATGIEEEEEEEEEEEDRVQTCHSFIPATKNKFSS